MPEFASTETNKAYVAPQSYQDVHAGADEAADFVPLTGALSVIAIGGLPIVGIENLSISEVNTQNPIFTLGMLHALAFEQQNITVNVSGTITQNARQSLQNSEFYPNGPEELAKYLSTTYDIEVAFQDFSKGSAERVTEPVFIIKNCKRSGSNITFAAGKISDAVTVQGTYLIRDFSKLTEYYKEQAA